MFRLSDATRRLAATGLFVLLCVVPTVLVIAIGLWRTLPGRAAAEQRRLSLLLGQPVRLASIRALHPGATLLGGLEILDPETGKILLECDQVRAELDTVRRKGDKAGTPRLRIAANRVTIVAESLEAFRPMADRLLQRRIDGVPPLADLRVNRIVLKKVGCEFPAQADITLQPHQSLVTARFSLKGQTPPVTLCADRRRDYLPPIDGFQLVSQPGGPVPCSLLSAILPGFPDLGAAAQFQGVINVNRVPEGCRLDGKAIIPGSQVDVQGDFLHIDLQQLVGDFLPHQVTGTGSLRIKDLKVRAGRIAWMEGRLHAQNGRIARELVASCVKELGLETTFPIMGATVASLPYDELAAGFHLDARGLSLSGECNCEPAGALMVGGYTYRLEGPPPGAPRIEAPKAVAALTSTSESQLSMSPYATVLLQRVPLIPPATSIIIAGPQGTSPLASRP